MTHSSVREGSAFLLLFFLKYNTNFVYVHNFYLIYALSASAFQTTFTLLYKNICFTLSRRKYRSDENGFCLFRLFARAQRRFLFLIRGHRVVGFAVFHATMRHIDQLKCTMSHVPPNATEDSESILGGTMLTARLNCLCYLCIILHTSISWRHFSR